MLTDLRYACRLLVAAPGWTLVAGLSLAVGIAANAVVFSVVDAVLLDPFPFRDQGRLMLLWGSKSETETPGISGADLEDWRTQSRTFEDIDGFLGNLSFSLGEGDAASVPAACLGDRVLPILGVEPALGRNFSPQEARYGGPSVVLLSDNLWRSRFSADPTIVGRTIRLHDRQHTVVGVMPPQFFFPDTDAALWVPAPCGIAEFSSRSSQTLHAIGRLRDGETVTTASADMDVVTERLAQTYPATNRNRSVGVFPLRQIVIGDYQRALFFLFAGVALTLIIACANLVHLHLARGLQRETEIAIRAATGASRARIARQLLIESAALVVPAGAVALLLTAGGLRALQSLAFTDIPRMAGAQIDARVVAFAVVLSATATLLSGLWPAWRLSGTAPADALRVGWGATRTRGSSRVRDLLATSEIAATVVLLVAGGLVVRSFVELSRANWGFDPDKLLLVTIRLPSDLTDFESQTHLGAAIKERLEQAPGIARAAVSRIAPIRWTSWRPVPLLADGRLIDGSGVWSIGHGYLATAGIPILEGRDFGSEDDEKAPRRVVISRAAAQRLWPGQSAVGRRLGILEMRTVAGKPDPAVERRVRERRRFDIADMQPVDGEMWEVIGVAADVRMFGLDVSPDPAVYVDARQQPQARGWRTRSAELKVLARLETDRPGVIDTAKAHILAIAPEVTFTEVAMMSELVSRSIGGRGGNALLATISSAFGILALFFATIGVFGVVSHSVSARLREIGIRVALGADRRAVARLVMAQGIRLLVLGLSIGVLVAWTLTRGMGAMLFAVAPGDTLTYLGAALALGLAVLLACVSPMVQALRFDAASLFRAG